MIEVNIIMVILYSLFLSVTPLILGFYMGVLCKTRSDKRKRGTKIDEIYKERQILVRKRFKDGLDQQEEQKLKIIRKKLNEIDYILYSDLFEEKSINERESETIQNNKLSFDEIDEMMKNKDKGETKTKDLETLKPFV